VTLDGSKFRRPNLPNSQKKSYSCPGCRERDCWPSICRLGPSGTRCDCHRATDSNPHIRAMANSRMPPFAPRLVA